MNSQASAVWQGTLKEGAGAVSTRSGALMAKRFSYSSRFEGEKGTTPEELIGAAHASCFSMALARILGDAGFPAERIETTATVTLEQNEGTFAIASSHLEVAARVPRIDDVTFRVLAARAKTNCVVSKVLNTAITVEERLF